VSARPFETCTVLAAFATVLKAKACTSAIDSNLQTKDCLISVDWTVTIIGVQLRRQKGRSRPLSTRRKVKEH
jgi:hypothetical protein